MKSLSQKERVELFEAFGLSDTNYLFVETSQRLILRARRMRGAVGKPLIEKTHLEDLVGESALMIWDHPDLCRSFTASPPSFWEQVLPSPLHQLARFTISPPAFKDQWQRLREAFTQLAGKLSETEVSLLHVHGLGDFPLFTHFVRGRCVRAGTSASLKTLVEKHRLGTLTQDDLRSTFGTQASFLSLELGTPGSDAFCEAVRDLVRRPADVRFRITPLELGL